MKKIDMEIKNWLCDGDEEWAEELKTITVDEALARADIDVYDLWDLIEWLRKFCD